MPQVQYQYFDSKGNQHTKVIEKKTLPSLITAMKNHLEKVELYHISHVSPDLVSYDFTQHGDCFKGGLNNEQLHYSRR